MRKGFTLIELIVVIAIIAILAAIIAPNAFKSIEKARISGVEGDYRTIKTGAMSYYSDTGNWPANANSTGFTDSDGRSGWDGPYLEKWPQRNPWGGVYSWRNMAAVTLFGGNATTRYISANNVPQAGANKVDTNLDDGNLTTGSTVWSATGLTMSFEVSNDEY
jgi:general secretion pathway protein G